MKVSCLKAWAMAARLRTLPIPTIQIAVSTAIAAPFVPIINRTIVFGAWLVSLLITVGMNLLNDVIDFEKGGDPLNKPGQSKVIPLGLLSKEAVSRAGWTSLCLACLIPFFLPVGWPIVLLVFLSALCGYCYTGGPYPISYLGLSELFIFVFYGWVCMITPFYLQTGMINEEIIVISSAMGLLAILPNALNNFRDIEVDAAIEKQTLAVRFGASFARWELTFLTFLPYMLIANYMLFPLILLPLAIVFVHGIWTASLVDSYFKHSILLLFLTGALTIISLCLL